jgi:hypothetical protein
LLISIPLQEKLEEEDQFSLFGNLEKCIGNEEVELRETTLGRKE